MIKNFYESIKHSTQESQVQEVYNEALKSAFNISIIERKHQCDGYLESKLSDGKEISILIEYKHDIQMKDRVQRSKVIAQCLGYLKQFEQSGEKLPKLVFIGDINECCVIHTNDLLKYLDLENIDWSIAPSSMGDKNVDLVFNIAKDISPWVYDVNEDFKFKDVADKIVDLCSNISRKLYITEKNIEKVYNLFCDRVIKDKKKVQANDLVSTFIGTMLDSEHYYQHPKKKNILIANDKQVAINGDQFELFMQMHSTEYSPKEKRIMTAISDRLIEDTNRRNKGEFYTPTLFVDYAHSMIEKELGLHWKENYVVWDCCCGTKNLTRDYKFKELYCSTLEQAELDISKNYNKEATSFQFDFLNDSLDVLKAKAPKLMEAFELNKPIVFFLNPPYAGASNIGDTAKKGLANTKIGLAMKNINAGAGSQNLYIQFLFRIFQIKQQYKLANAYIGIFCPPLFLSGGSCKNFRKIFLNDFKLNNAILFNAGHFANVRASWGISFSLWCTGAQVNKNEFNYNTADNVDDKIEIIGSKIIYNTDNQLTLSDFLSNKSRCQEKQEFPNFTSAIKISLNNNFACKNTFGYLVNGGNNIECSMMRCSLLSGPFSNAHGKNINSENVIESMLVFSVRKIVESSWINSKDEYLAPNESHPKFQEFLNNSIVYSLFNTSSNQSSLRQIKYHDKLWDIKNEFFWMSKQEIINLSEEYNNDYTYEDALNSDERFVYTKLQEIKDDLSPEAKSVLDKATELVKKSFKYREMFNESLPEYQINNWDCGFYQIKALLKEFMPDDIKEFRNIYKQLADKMRPMVYELGFLKK